jgi:iron complex transport system substrate-binding protein
MRRHRRRAPLVPILLCLALGVAACGGDDDEEGAGGEAARGQPSTRVVDVSWGQVEVPGDPERIVAINQNVADMLIALDHKPVGAFVYGDFSDYMKERAEGIELIGSGTLDIEKLAVLQPDLVVGFDVDREEPWYRQVKDIAPFVGVASEDQDWRKWTASIADFVNAREEYDEVMARVDARIEAARAQVEGESVTLIEPMPEGKVWWYGPRSPSGRLLAEMGIDVQDIPKGTGMFGGDAIGEIPEERVTELEGDTLFVTTRSIGDERARQLLAKPLWQKVPAVASGEVVYVDGQTWVDLTPYTVMDVVDEVVAGLR